MKKLICLFVLFFIVSSQKSNINEKEKFIENLISQMTLEEKVGQMTQINVTVIAKGPNRFSSSTPMEIDLSRANKALVDYKVGSVLNTINNTAQKPSVWFQNISKIFPSTFRHEYPTEQSGVFICGAICMH